jgi:hypothetical protein
MFYLLFVQHVNIFFDFRSKFIDLPISRRYQLFMDIYNICKFYTTILRQTQIVQLTNLSVQLKCLQLKQSNLLLFDKISRKLAWN